MIPAVADKRPETISVFQDLSQSDKGVFTTKLQDEGSSRLPRGASPGGSHPCRQRAAGGQGQIVPGSSGGHAEARAGRERHAGSREAQHLHASPATPSHVHRTHGDPRHLQVHQHGGVMPGVRCGYYWEFHSAQDHLQEQVHAKRAQHPHRQPGARGLAAHHHRHPHQRLQGEPISIQLRSIP